MADLTQFEAALALYLQDAELTEIHETEDAVQISLIYPQVFAMDFQTLNASEDNHKRLLHYFKTVLDREVILEITLSDQPDSQETIRRAALRQYLGSSEYEWRSDLLSFPILDQMQELLKLNFLGSRGAEMIPNTDDFAQILDSSDTEEDS